MGLLQNGFTLRRVERIIARLARPDRLQKLPSLAG
jgi:hypothetical protein